MKLEPNEAKKTTEKTEKQQNAQKVKGESYF